MPADRYCNAILHEERSSSFEMRCELVEWHDGDHWIFDNTKDGISWPLTAEDVLGREVNRLAGRLAKILHSVDCDEPMRVSRFYPSEAPDFTYAACLNVAHLRAVLEVIERRRRE